ncbi:hypothetical protein BSQ40_28285 [Serratia fonticola]|jgi:hypothetical protein|nr:hypothetical protein BSQ40_28285 [Serratia fonticola]
MGASGRHFNRAIFFILYVANVKLFTEIKSCHLLKHQIVIYVHSFITNQHMIWAATIAAVNTSAVDPLGNIILLSCT